MDMYVSILHLRVHYNNVCQDSANRDPMSISWPFFGVGGVMILSL